MNTRGKRGEQRKISLQKTLKEKRCQKQAAFGLISDEQSDGGSSSDDDAYGDEVDRINSSFKVSAPE